MCGLYKLKPEVVNGALLKVMETFFIRQITENHVKWTNCQVEQHKGSGSSRVYFRSAIFFVYLSDLSSELCRSPKLLADNKSPFSVAKNVNETAKRPNKDLENISRLAHWWRMSFNSDPTKMIK